MSTISIKMERLEQLEKKALIMYAATEALIHRLEDYNPDDEIAAGAGWSIQEFKTELRNLRD
ncbi:MAG: hypothetical protein JJ958_06700 [Balneola sp.]|nr:hypothetical protein [Balneola sp.]